MERVAVQIVSTRSKVLGLTADARVAVATACQPELSVHWLPARVPTDSEERSRTDAGFSLETVVLVYLLGTAIGAVLKPLAEAIANEAGKDLWAGLKKLIAGVWHRQSAEAYTLTSRVYVLIELGHDHAAIRFDFPVSRATLTEPEVLDFLKPQLESLGASTARIFGTIDRFQVGSTFSGQVHVIFRKGDRWEIYPVDSKEFP